MKKVTFLLFAGFVALCQTSEEMSWEQRVSNFNKSLSSLQKWKKLECNNIEEYCIESSKSPLYDTESMLKDCKHVMGGYVCDGINKGQELEDLYKYFLESEYVKPKYLNEDV